MSVTWAILTFARHAMMLRYTVTRKIICWWTCEESVARLCQESIIPISRTRASGLLLSSKSTPAVRYLYFSVARLTCPILNVSQVVQDALSPSRLLLRHQTCFQSLSVLSRSVSYVYANLTWKTFRFIRLLRLNTSISCMVFYGLAINP